MVFDFLYLLNGLVQLLVSIFGFTVSYNLSYKKKEHFGFIICAISVSYLLFSLLNIFWFFGFLEKSFEDLITIASFFVSAVALLFLLMSYKLFNSKKLIFYFFIFLGIYIALYFIFHNFFLIGFVSLLLLLIVFLDFEFFDDKYIKRSSTIGIFYSLIYFFLFLMIYFGSKFLFSFIPDILMAYVFYNLMHYSKKHRSRIRIKKLKTNSILKFLRFALFSLSFVSFLIFGSLAVHEVGHALVSKAYGCSYVAVVYQSINEAYTEIECDSPPNEFLILIGGLVLTSFLALIFFLTGETFIKNMSLLIFSFGVIIANKDFLDLGISQNFIFVFNFIAAVLLIVGVFGIINQFLDRYKKTKKVFSTKKK